MSGSTPAGWPHGVKRVAVEDLRHLGINDNNELFWDGRRVEIRRPLVLTGFQKFVTAVVTIFAVLGGIGGFVTGISNGSVFLCARGVQILSCPVPTDAKLAVPPQQ
jgi:hypothetical protein